MLRDSDLTSSQVAQLVSRAIELKARRRAGTARPELAGHNLALIFEKPSTRTRSAFEIAAAHQGARVTYLDSATLHIGELESVCDTGQVLGRLYDGVAYRARRQETLEEFARRAGVPVWNALTDRWHPTQALADMLTVREHTAKPWDEISLAFLGDGASNIANSLRVTGALLGMTVRIVAPAALAGECSVTDTAADICRTTGGTVIETDDVDEGVRDADFVYTDTWVRINEPVEQWRDRVRRLLPYRVDRNLLARTKNPDVKYLHCLPAVHNTTTLVGRQIHQETGLEGAEVSDEVFGSAASVVFDQAENRVHAITAMLVTSLTQREAPHDAVTATPGGG
ncbi:ornithine carbamoyltransferase [Nocardia brasiliensis]|uniref:ornithine carbamoyltransferase n=1 Tax=Nocardia brasiliensis TaxID=37326 RepID=UPI00366C551F